MRAKALAIVSATVAALALAGCGGGASSDGAAAGCLEKALNYLVTSGDCNASQDKTFEVPRPVTATCLRREGNDFVCQTSDGSAYAVTFDGSKLAYQRTQ